MIRALGSTFYAKMNGAFVKWGCVTEIGALTESRQKRDRTSLISKVPKSEAGHFERSTIAITGTFDKSRLNIISDFFRTGTVFEAQVHIGDVLYETVVGSFTCYMTDYSIAELSADSVVTFSATLQLESAIDYDMREWDNDAWLWDNNETIEWDNGEPVELEE